MSLRERLAVALEQGLQRSPELLAGDVLEMEGGAELTPAAVLVPVVERQEPTLILTVRPETMRQHAGQVSFPGGRIDPNDQDAVAAALREAEEEIALPASDVDVIGTADRYRTVTGFEVTPVIGVVPPGISLRPCPSEVADLFEAPVAHLFDPVNHILRKVEWCGRERSYYEILWDDRRIWGATAAMIVNLSRRMVLA